jgi:hypothetical protein
MFMTTMPRVRIAEICQHTITHVFGDKSSITLDQLRAAAVIGGHNAPQVFGIELGRQCSRAHEIAERDCQLAPFGIISPRSLGSHGSRGRRNGNRSFAEIADRAQHFQPVPKRDAKIFEMLLRQVGKNGNIDLVIGKALSVLGHAELFEPVRNLLHRGHQGPVVACLSFGPQQERVYADKFTIARLVKSAAQPDVACRGYAKCLGL